MLNRIIIHGRLTRDPEARVTPSGTPVCNFTVAVDRDYTKEDKQTDYIDCVAWRTEADFISKYFHKGKEIIVHGSLQSRKWQDKDGNSRTSWEIKVDGADFCGSKATADGSSPPANTEAAKEEVPF